jgi:hypothetical protein
MDVPKWKELLTRGQCSQSSQQHWHNTLLCPVAWHTPKLGGEITPISLGVTQLGNHLGQGAQQPDTTQLGDTGMHNR